MSNKKEKRLDENSKTFRNPTQPFQPYDDDVLSALDADDVSEDTLPINKIIPDPTQPRRIIPYQFLDVLEDGYGAVIGAWEEYVFDSTDDFPTVDLLEGKESVGDYVNDDPLVIEFAEMVSFAANIHDIGLNQAIGVVTRGDVYRIIYGERRWTAFQFLNHYLGGYERIPSKVANVSEWELAKMQSAENFQRPELNAIAKARMFAKLLMIARSDGGERYDSWNQVVAPNGCDRPWYAQVANGEIHRIPRGMATQFSQALNISEDTMRKYRSLLKLFSDHNLAHQVNNAIWMLGDAGNWAEGFMRDIGQYLQVDDVDKILNGTGGYTVTVGTVSRTEDALREAVASAKSVAESKKKQADTHPTPNPSPKHQGGEQEPVDKSQWESFMWVGKEADAGGVKVFVTNCTAPETVMVQYPQADGTVKEVPLNIFALEPVPSSKRDGDNADNVKPDGTFSYMDKNGVAIKLHDTVMTRRGATATVIGFNGRYVEVKSDNVFVSKGHYPEWLEVLKPLPDEPDADALYVGDMVMTDDGRGVGMIVEFISGNVARVETPMGVWAYGVPRLTKVEQKPNTLLYPPHPPTPSPTRGDGEREQSGLEKSDYPAQGETSASQLVGKPMLYKEQPTIVIADAGNGEMLIQLGKERVVVPIGELSFHPETDDDDDYEDEADATRRGLVLASDDVMRRYLEPYRMLSVVLNNEHATTAIEWLMNLTYERTNRQQLEAAMNHVIDHVEDINKTVEEIMFEQFRLKLEEL